jgi:hypothetical protein
MKIGKVEKGIEIKPISPSSRFPFEGMKVGDSFLIEGCNHSERSCALMAIKRFNGHWKASSRTVEGGIRIWRVQ